MKLREFSSKIKYYWKVWIRVVKSSLKRSYFYKQEFFFQVLRTIYILLAQIVILSVLFSDSDMYVGWSRSEAYLVMGIWNLLNYVGWGLFGVNLLNLENKVVDGSLDYVLLKPISVAWLSSFADFFIYNFITSFSGVILISYYIIVNWSSLTFLNLFYGFLSLCIGMLIWYFVYLIFASFTISSPRNGLLAVAKEILGMSKYPVNIFGNVGTVLFYTIIPLAFLTTVPARFLIDSMSVSYIGCGIIVVVVLYMIAKILWRWNIRKYGSASS
ncbi:MAG: ABC transporter permease [Candidatus Dojkabacteria bacterium]|jgi:ABC-2 type transport system permease protein